jgi:solute carrier family 25 carnitine/acylcarnitine transporter 20/29
MSSGEPTLFQRAVYDVIGGTVGGIGIVAVGHPFDTMKVRLQTQDPANPRYAGLGDCMRKTYTAEGLAGFYKGFASPLYGQMIFNAVQFVAYGFAKDFSQSIMTEEHQKAALARGESVPLTIPQLFLAGAVTGSIVAFIEGPIDLMKTQMQTQVFKEKPLFNTFFGTVKYIAGNYGLRGVYQGLGPTILRNVPAVSWYFGAYEWARMRLCAPGETINTLPTYKVLAAGALGGLMYWVTVYPIDVVKSAIQCDAPNKSERRFKSTIDAFRQLAREGGLKRFFVGISPCLLRAAPANAVCFMLYQKTVELLGGGK